MVAAPVAVGTLYHRLVVEVRADVSQRGGQGQGFLEDLEVELRREVGDGEGIMRRVCAGEH